MHPASTQNFEGFLQLEHTLNDMANKQFQFHYDWKFMLEND